MTNEVVEKKQDTVQSLILKMKDQFALALPKHLSPDRFTRVALTIYNKTPKLRDCTPQSLLACLMDCSQLGLEPDGRKAHLIPYGNQCQLIVDYKGLVELARRSGDIADIHADVVHEKDHFDFQFGNDSRLVHKPTLTDRGKPIAAYSYVRLKDGSSSFEVMSASDIEAIRGRSKASKSGPWVTDWNEMAKKTVFRRHSKWLPLTSEFQAAVEKDFDTPEDLVPLALDKQEIEMPRAKATSPSGAPTAAPEAQQEDANPAPLASPAQMKNLYALGAQAGFDNEKLFDFIAERAADPDKLRVPELQKCLEDLAAVIDGKKVKK